MDDVGYVLTGMPFVAIGMPAVAGGDYLHPLFHTGVGIVLIVAAFLLLMIGSVVLRKIASFRTEPSRLRRL